MILRCCCVPQTSPPPRAEVAATNGRPNQPNERTLRTTAVQLVGAMTRRPVAGYFRKQWVGL